jgi:uncharacterized membrane protein YidH (DUF202 family)
MKTTESEDQIVELLFRNGTLTVAGIVLAFSLGFLTQWAGNPIPWKLTDLPSLILISAGIVLQLTALIRLLRHDSLIRRHFDRASSWLIGGVVVTSAGVISAIVIDFIELVV